MNKNLFNVLLFTGGAAIGSLVTWKVVKTKYERIIQEEIDSFKKTYTLCMQGASMINESAEYSDDDELDESEDDDCGFDESTMTDYHTLANKYKNSSDDAENGREGDGDDEVPYINGPYVIAPEDFGDGEYDHECCCLTYYSDGVLSNDWYEKFDIDETIGEDSLNHFDEYTEDVVHVRNERLHADYEVTRDPRNYADMVANDPLMGAYAN